MDQFDDSLARTTAVLSAMRPLYPHRIGPSTTLFADLGMDSLDFASLMVHLEQEFEIAIDSKDLEAMAMVRAIPAEDLVDGVVSDSWLARVRPFLRADQFQGPVRPSDLLDTVTVAFVAEMVMRSRNSAG